MKRNNITKNDILKNIQKRNGLPISYLEEIFEHILFVIKEGLLKNGIFKISGFGTFKVLFKNQRVGMNPKTKVKYEISKRKVVIFSPSKIIKKKINENG